MRAKTRYFLIVAVLVLAVGVGTGLVAYFTGLPNGLLAGAEGPQVLGLIPPEAGFVAHVDMRDIMASEVRQRLKNLLPVEATGQQELEARTGINLERDVDEVTVALVPLAEASRGLGVLVLVGGRFDQNRIERLMLDGGARAEPYRGASVLVTQTGQATRDAFSLVFINPGLVAVGGRRLVGSAIDHQVDGSQSVTTNAELMALVRTFADRDAWAVGRVDALVSRVPDDLTRQLPPLTWFGGGVQVNGGVSGSLQVEAASDESAANLKEVVRGVVAFARLQADSTPALKPLLDSLVLGGAGRLITFNFNVPVSLLDSLPPLKP